MSRPASGPRSIAMLVGALVLLGCVPQARGFEAWSAAWTAEVSDRTGSVAGIEVLAGAGPGSELAADAVRVRNLGPAAVEVAWLGGACVDCAHFSIAPAVDARIALRYEIGAPCDEPAAAGYALEIRFVHPIEATSITPIPDWGP